MSLSTCFRCSPKTQQLARGCTLEDGLGSWFTSAVWGSSALGVEQGTAYPSPFPGHRKVACQGSCTPAPALPTYLRYMPTAYAHRKE